MRYICPRHRCSTFISIISTLQMHNCGRLFPTPELRQQLSQMTSADISLTCIDMCSGIQVGQVSPLCVCLAHAVMWAQDYCRLHSASCAALQIIIIWGAEACSHVNDEVLFLKCEITPRCGWGCCSAITLRRQLDRWAFKWSSCRSILKSFNLNCFQLVGALHAHSASWEERGYSQSLVVTKMGSCCELANDGGSSVDAAKDTLYHNLAIFSHLKKSKERHERLVSTSYWLGRFLFFASSQAPPTGVTITPAFSPVEPNPGAFNSWCASLELAWTLHLNPKLVQIKQLDSGPLASEGAVCP